MGRMEVTSDTSNFMFCSGLVGVEDEISGIQGTLTKVLKSQGTFTKGNLSEKKV